MTYDHRPPQSGPAARSDLKLRIQTALIIAPIGLGIVWAGSPIFELGLYIVLSLALKEWIVTLFSRPLQSWWLAIAMLGFCLAAVSLPQMGGGGMTVAVPILAGCVMLLYLSPAPWGGAAAAAGLLYIGFAALCASALRSTPEWGGLLTFFTISVCIATDVGAYISGRYFGGPKLAASISPNKTWSGLIGGMVCAAGVGFAFAAYAGQSLVSPDSPLMLLAAIGAVCLAVISQLGDLAESFIKRQRRVKDSGSLLPGHGGILDRIDGHLPAFIFAFLMSESVLHLVTK